MISLPISVLKFGSSVLCGEISLMGAVHEIYREVRRGRRVLAVVSALGDRTDALEAQAQRLSRDEHRRAHAALLATGEAHAVAALSLTLTGAGLAACGLEAWQLGLRTGGPRLDATPRDLDLVGLRRFLERHQVVVVPGFVGCADDGSATLLGRGGSDLTALYVAHRLQAETCRLLKDVNGWFESDPAARGAPPRRYLNLNWDEAMARPAPIVQHKAVCLARQLNQPFSIAALGSGRPTRVNGQPSTLAVEPERTPLRVVLLGLGVVGQAVARCLAADPQRFQLMSVLVRDATRPRNHLPDPSLLTTDPLRALEPEADLVIELLGRLEPAQALLVAALRGHKHVVTANKAVLARHRDELLALARERGLSLNYSAAVGGAVPMLEVVQQLARDEGIQELRGVVNATCNFILDELARGGDLEQAGRKAQRLGLAESDLQSDLTGQDSAEKLVLLCQAAFHRAPQLGSFEVAGIEHLGSPGRSQPAQTCPRLVVRALKDSGGVQACVRLEELDLDHVLARVRGPGNALIITTQAGRQVTLTGRGAGGLPTAMAVMGDVYALMRCLEDAHSKVPCAPGRS